MEDESTCQLSRVLIDHPTHSDQCGSTLLLHVSSIDLPVCTGGWIGDFKKFKGVTEGGGFHIAVRGTMFVRNGAVTPGPSRECDIIFFVNRQPKSAQQLRYSTVAARRTQSVTLPQNFCEQVGVSYLFFCGQRRARSGKSHPWTNTSVGGGTLEELSGTLVHTNFPGKGRTTKVSNSFWGSQA